MTEGVVDDLEVVEVEEEDGRHLIGTTFAAGGPQRPLERQLEHAAVGRAGQRVALGEVLDMLEECGVPEVERRDRRELPEHRRDASLDAGPPRPMLDDQRTDRPAFGDHRRDEHIPRIRHQPGQQRIARRIESLDRQGGASFPRPADDPVSVGRRGRGFGRAVRREDDDPAIRLPEQDAAFEAEATDHSLQDDVGLLDGVGDGIELRTDIDQRLEVGATKTQLAFVEGREDGGGDGEQPERGDVEDRHPVEFDTDAGRDIDRRNEPGRLRIEDDEQQQRMPEGHLEAGPV